MTAAVPWETSLDGAQAALIPLIHTRFVLSGMGLLIHPDISFLPSFLSFQLPS